MQSGAVPAARPALSRSARAAGSRPRTARIRSPSAVQAARRKGRSKTSTMAPSVPNTACTAAASRRSPLPMEPTRCATTPCVSRRSSRSSRPRVAMMAASRWEAPKAAALGSAASTSSRRGVGRPAASESSARMLPSWRSSGSASRGGRAARSAVAAAIALRRWKPASRSQTRAAKSMPGSTSCAACRNSRAACMAPAGPCASRMSRPCEKAATQPPIQPVSPCSAASIAAGARPIQASSFRPSASSSRTSGPVMVLSTAPMPAASPRQSSAQSRAWRRRLACSAKKLVRSAGAAAMSGIVPAYTGTRGRNGGWSESDGGRREVARRPGRIKSGHDGEDATWGERRGGVSSPATRPPAPPAPRHGCRGPPPRPPAAGPGRPDPGRRLGGDRFQRAAQHPLARCPAAFHHRGRRRGIEALATSPSRIGRSMLMPM